MSLCGEGEVSDINFTLMLLALSSAFQRQFAFL